MDTLFKFGLHLIKWLGIGLIYWSGNLTGRGSWGWSLLPLFAGLFILAVGYRMVIAWELAGSSRIVITEKKDEP